MERFLDAVRLGIENCNWYGAIAMALTLPDICGRLENPGESTKKRYVNWYNQYLRSTYTGNIGLSHTPHVFLGGEDCYALRCSYLHEGADDISGQSAKKALDKFHFVAPRKGWHIHRNQSNSTLQLQVDTFCWDMCNAVKAWMQEMVDTKPDVTQKFNELLTIHSLDNGFSF